MKAKKVIALLCVAAMMSGTSVTVLAQDAQPAQTAAEAAAENSTEEAPAAEGAYDSRLDAGKIILTPGKDETALNFAWYSEQSGTPAVKIGTKADLSDARVFEGTATAIDKTTDNDAGEGIDYTASNKVTTGTGFVAENTTYYYSYTWNNGENAEWSDVYEYTSQGFDSFQTILVGDPQMGASGSEGQGTVDDANIASDLAGWQKTLDMASEIAPDASFILSAGDQIDYSSADADYIRELEFAAFSTPEQLRSLPLATTIGNHESKGDDYQYHYNNPNVDPELGDTNSGADYYFSYGDVLFISLNSNNRNAAEHSEVIERAIASHEDATWKVVMFHHDIYGSGQPHSDVDGANLRTIFAPLMDQYDNDVCLTGHDHSYARTYQIIDGKAIDYGNEEAVNPDGTLYIAAGSASGSKFYELNAVQQYYIAERNNTPTPTFSTIDFTDNSFTIKTYDNTGAKYAGDFTITKTEDQASLLSLINESEDIHASDYTTDSYRTYEDAVDAAKDYLETDKDAVPSELVDNYDEENQGDNPDDPLNYYGYAQGDYAAEDSTRLREGYADFLDKTMDNSQGVKTSEEYQQIYNNLVDAKAGLTEAQELPYVDVSEDGYYYEAAKRLYEDGIMTGMDDTHFGPSVSLSRAHFVTILYRMAGSPEVTSEVTFPDVEEGQFYTDAVAWAVEAGVVTGYDEGNFGPADEITREQIATMLYRYSGNAGIAAQTTVLDFPDAMEISPFAREAMIWAVSNNIMSGRENGTLAPTDNASRADAAVMVDRYLG